MKLKNQKVKFLTLGCSKNLVDTEHIMAIAKSQGIEIVDGNSKVETMIINTCGFIKSAKEESINAILEAVESKKSGEIKNLYVTGCLSDRYLNELKIEIPEVNKYFGSTHKLRTVEQILNKLGVNYKKELQGERFITTPGHYAYLKISEGCNNPCSFCAIPIMRGKHISKPLNLIINEVKLLANKGVKEIIIIGQDTTYWGFDRDRKRNLSNLLNAISNIDGINWIRLMYAYPSGFPENIIDTIKNNENICNYLDIPVQHISDKILKSMQRRITKKSTINLLEKIRKEIPDICLRTTLITGYPGESEKEFNELLDFVKNFKFDRLGVFTYSREENTKSFRLGDDIPEKEKILRQKLILDAQREISFKLNENEIGKVFKTIIDRKENNYYVGRTYKDAPEIDQEVIITNSAFLNTGDFCNVRINDFEEFDLFGDVELNCK